MDRNLLQIQWTHIRMGFRGRDSRADEARANMITFEFRVGLSHNVRIGRVFLEYFIFRTQVGDYLA